MRNVVRAHNQTPSFIDDLQSAAIVSSLLVLPLAVLEALHTTITMQNAAGIIVLFGLLWLLPTTFVLIGLPLVRAGRARHIVSKRFVSVLLRIGLLTVIATMWGGIVLDQLPCFLAYPNCD